MARAWRSDPKRAITSRVSHAQLDDLQRHLASQWRALARQIHHAHPAFAQRSDDLVGTYFLPRHFGKFQGRFPLHFRIRTVVKQEVAGLGQQLRVFTLGLEKGVALDFGQLECLSHNIFQVLIAFLVHDYRPPRLFFNPDLHLLPQY
jgi:hypothetical protein